MRSSLRCLPMLAVGAAVVLAFACHGKAPNTTPSADCSDACVDGTADAGVVLAASGLDERPRGTACKVQARPPLASDVALANAFPDLPVKFDVPVGVVVPPNEPERVVVWEKEGGFKSFAKTAKTAAAVTTLLDWPANTINADNEGGFLGVAFHPKWPSEPEVYVSYTTFSATAPNRSNMKSVLARYRSKDGGKTLDPSTADVFLSFDQPYTNHNGGNIAFGPDGYLYAGFGDGGSGGDPLGNGQNKDVPFGKMLRLDVIGSARGTYGIPPTNPFATGGGRKDVYAYGLRNPWRWSFDRETGELWAGDVGQSMYEEIDKIVLGGNYGWNVREGFHCYNAATCENAGFIDPIVEHNRTEARSITGGYVYRGKAMPGLVGTYVYGDYETGNVWALLYDAAGKPAPKVIASVGEMLLASFGEDADGEILLVRFDGVLSRLVPAGPPPADTFPKTLSATGCVDAADPTKPAAGLLAYGVNSPLWSDGSEKERYLALPDDAQITIGADGDWDLPIGAVLMKSFRLGARLVETRLLMRHEDGGWGGYTYEWNDAQTDATLLPAGKVTTVAGQTWTYPSRSQCQECHTKAAGGSLGLETGQLNGSRTYPETGRYANQVATFAAIGLFTNPPVGDAAALACLATPGSTDESIEARARAYLHANCAHCHRPEGGGRGTLDLRYTQSVADTKTCNEEQHEGKLGPAGAKLLVPGDPDKSVLALRFHAQDGSRMPPIATSVEDPTGAQVLDAWIRSLTGCP